MRHLIACGIVCTLSICGSGVQVNAEPPPVEPITVIGEHSDSDRETPNFAAAQKLLQQHPELVGKIQKLIETNPDFVASIFQQTLRKYPNLIQEIHSNPQIARSTIVSNPQLIQTIIANPKLLEQLSKSELTPDFASLRKGLP